MSTTPEGKVKTEIKKYLDSIEAYHFWPVQTGYGAATVDCLGCYRGQFFAIEVKAGRNEATMRQRLTIKKIRASWGVAFVARSKNDVKNWFEDQQTWHEDPWTWD